MDSNSEIIALVLDEHGATGLPTYSEGAKRLIRDADGHMSLEAIESERDFEETARITGCFQRGKAIRDPKSLEVIGYEMEEVELRRPIAAIV